MHQFKLEVNSFLFTPLKYHFLTSMNFASHVPITLEPPKHHSYLFYFSSKSARFHPSAIKSDY